MYFRCQILINGISYEATDDLKNWDDFELAYKRSDYDGVLRSFSTKFEFVNRSYNLLKEEYSKNYLSSSAGIAFYKRNNSWNWDKVFQCALDFPLIRMMGIQSLLTQLMIRWPLLLKLREIFSMSIWCLN